MDIPTCYRLAQALVVTMDHRGQWWVLKKLEREEIDEKQAMNLLSHLRPDSNRETGREHVVESVATQVATLAEPPS